MFASRLGSWSSLFIVFLLAHASSCNGNRTSVRGGDKNKHDDDSAPVVSATPQTLEVVAKSRGEGDQAHQRHLRNIFTARRKRKSKSPKYDETPIEQTSRINVNKYISCVATDYAAAHQRKSLRITVPPEAKVGDTCFIVVGGSASGRARPEVPSPSAGLKVIDLVGPTDINLKAYQMRVTASTKGQRFTISGGKNTYAAITVLRGLDRNNAVYKSATLHNSMDGREGEAKAPSVNTVRNGAVIAAYLYDDPHIAEITNKGFSMMVSFRDGDDGMALGIGPTDGGSSGPIRAIGRGHRKGGGNEVTMSISLRPDD